ncbi:voltage-dependent anion-selective channel protein 1-like isoform 1 [Planoprotostelium fungivorum]|nr:voltage-dependent anion-selective channel protein 1-like isoform 1 [Planoprotostelium fungivorum]
MPQPLYKDLTKRTNDLLTKEYPSDTKFDFTRKTNQDGTIEGNVVFRKDGPLVTLTPKYKFSVNGNPSSALLELTTKKDLKAEVTFEPTKVQGLKLIDTAFVKDDEINATFAAEYRIRRVTANASWEPRAKGHTTKAAAVFGFNDFSLGTFAEYFLGKQEQTFKEIAATATYNTPAYDIAAFAQLNSRGQTPKTEIGAKYFHNINKVWAFGGEAVFDATTPEERPKLAIAAQAKPDSETTFKVKVDGSGKVTGSLQQKLASNLKLTLSTAVDTNRFTHFSLNGTNNVGVQLSLLD